REHRSILQEQTAELREHRSILQEHTVLLKEHSAKLDRHDSLFVRMDGRLIGIEDELGRFRAEVGTISTAWAPAASAIVQLSQDFLARLRRLEAAVFPSQG